MSENKEREAFEAAWSKRYQAHGLTTFRRSEIVPNGYANTRVNDGWAMWQAALSTTAHGVGAMSEQQISEIASKHFSYESDMDAIVAFARAILRAAPAPVPAPASDDDLPGFLIAMSDWPESRLTQDEPGHFEDMAVEARWKGWKLRAAPASGEAGAQPVAWRDELRLIQSILNGFHPCLAKAQGLQAVNKLLAAVDAPIAADQEQARGMVGLTDERIRAIHRSVPNHHLDFARAIEREIRALLAPPPAAELERPTQAPTGESND